MSDDIDRDIKKMEALITEADEKLDQAEELGGIEEVSDEYPWAYDDDEVRRTFIFVQMIGVEHLPGDFVDNMYRVENWLKNGTLKGILKVVK